MTGWERPDRYDEKGTAVDAIKKMMSDITRKAGRFMIGRNGFDELGNAIVWAVIVVDILYMFTGYEVLHIVYTVGLIYWLFRIFSKNVAKRREENEKYRKFAGLIKARLTQSRDYKFYTCSKCGANVRVPRHRGKLEVTCPKCGEKKIVDTGAKK